MKTSWYSEWDLLFEVYQKAEQEQKYLGKDIDLKVITSGIILKTHKYEFKREDTI